jgi:hypothetical protein
MAVYYPIMSINILFLLAATISTSTNLASHQQTTGWVTSTQIVSDQRPRSSTAPVIVATVPTSKTDRKSKKI